MKDFNVNARVLLMCGAQAYPPAMSGASTVLYKLLKGITCDMLDVLTGEPGISDDRKLGFKVWRIPGTSWGKKRILWRAETFQGTLNYLRFGSRIISSGRYRRLLLVFPSSDSFMAGYILAKRHRLPFQAYLLDLMAESRIRLAEKALLGYLERKILEDAEVIYTLSRGITEHYSCDVRREYVLLPHCVEKTLPEDGARLGTGRKGKIIVFAGQIHDISLDALQNLVRAVRRIGLPEITIRLLTNRTRKYLESHDLLADFVEFQFAGGQEELRRNLREADILYSPVAFKSRYPKQAATCFPTKTFDYVLAQRPILVHAPLGSFYERYMSENVSAFCVTEYNEETLGQAILNLLRDGELQRTLVRNAACMLRRYHQKNDIQAIFLKRLQADV